MFCVVLGYVGNEVVVTDECIIGAACTVDGTESLPHRTIICGSRNQRYLLAQPPSVSSCWHGQTLGFDHARKARADLFKKGWLCQTKLL